MARQEIIEPAPFSLGLLTDQDPLSYGLRGAQVLTDAVWTSGMVAKRGGFQYVTADSLLSSSLVGCMIWPTVSGSYRLIVTDGSGNVGYITSYGYGSGATTSESAAGPTGNELVPVAFYDDEVILAYRDSADSLDPLVRWAGASTSGLSAPGGTIAFLQGDVVVGTGTTFTTQARVGCYITATSTLSARNMRVVAIESNTRLRVSHHASDETETFSGASWTINSTGYIGLRSRVSVDRLTAPGQASTTAASATLTGRGTTWNSGNYRLKVGDFLSTPDAGSAYGESFGYPVTAVASNTSLTLGDVAGSSGTYDYYASRQLCGRVATVHAGRLWVGNLPWAPRRLQVLPVGYALGGNNNGVDADPYNKITAEYVEVLNPNTAGEIRSLEPTPEPGPLFIGCDDACYVAFGEWPNTSITRLPNAPGLLSIRASCSSPLHGVFFLSRDGIHQYRPGGGVVDLSDGRVNRAYRSAAASATRGTIGVIDGYVIASVDDGATWNTWVYEIAGKRFCKWSSYNPVHVSQGLDTTGTRLFFIQNSTRRVADVKPALTDTGAAGDIYGTFAAQSGRRVLGEVAQPGRLTNLKTTFQLSNADTLRVRTGRDTMTTDQTLTGTADTNPRTSRITAPNAAGNVGDALNDLAVEYSESGSGQSLVRLHEVRAQVRTRRRSVSGE